MYVFCFGPLFQEWKAMSAKTNSLNVQFTIQLDGKGDCISFSVRDRSTYLTVITKLPPLAYSGATIATPVWVTYLILTKIHFHISRDSWINTIVIPEETKQSFAVSNVNGMKSHRSEWNTWWWHTPAPYSLNAWAESAHFLARQPSCEYF